jgi:hypothetical protein
MGNKHAATAGYAGSTRPAASPRPVCWRSAALDPERTYGAAADRFYKIVPRQASGPERRQNGRGEFDLLRRCRGLAGVPEALELIEDGDHQILVLRRVPGRPLGSLELGWFQFARVMLRLTRVVWAIARRGVRAQRPAARERPGRA